MLWQLEVSSLFLAATSDSTLSTTNLIKEMFNWIIYKGAMATGSKLTFLAATSDSTPSPTNLIKEIFNFIIYKGVLVTASELTFFLQLPMILLRAPQT